MPSLNAGKSSYYVCPHTTLRVLIPHAKGRSKAGTLVGPLSAKKRRGGKRCSFVAHCAGERAVERYLTNAPASFVDVYLLCVCVCVCVCCIYIYMYICIHICIHMYIRYASRAAERREKLVAECAGGEASCYRLACAGHDA